MPLHQSLLSCRLAAVIGMGLLTAACGATSNHIVLATPTQAIAPDVAKRYAAVETEKFYVPAVSLQDLKPRNVRQLVDYPNNYPRGTVVVDPHNRFLYLIQDRGKALRYGVGVGKAGLEFTGTATIDRKAQWPHWTPTPDMIRRDPGRYAKWRKGMDGGEGNPLGARALYLFKGGKDTLYRIHGTNEPETIGQAVSSGCIRMMNQDVMDLYRRVPQGSKVVVL